MMMKWWTVLGLALCIGGAACTAETEEEIESSDSAMRRVSSSGTPTEGGACKITSGPNSGKTGTYDTTSDPGHVWCCTEPNGGGSCTECTGRDTCTSAFTRWSPPVYNYGGTFTAAP